MLRRAHPGLRETSRTLNILAGQRQVINKFVADAGHHGGRAGQPQGRREPLGHRGRRRGRDRQSSRREDLRRDFQLLPTTLAELRPYMVQLRTLADDQIPTLRDLRTAAPDLNRLLARLGPFTEAARPAFRALGRTSISGIAALRETRQEVAALQKLGQDVPGFSKPLRQFLQTMDDAQRSVERDPRAARSAPPAPDKTADRTSAGRDGFTGFEAFWDYAYWQALAINGRDSKSHILRINAFPGACADYRATDEGAGAVFQECKQNLGPEPARHRRPARPDRSAARARSRGQGEQHASATQGSRSRRA